MRRSPDRTRDTRQATLARGHPPPRGRVTVETSRTCHSTLLSLTGDTDGAALGLGTGEAVAVGDGERVEVPLRVGVALEVGDARAEAEADCEGETLGVEVVDSERDADGDGEGVADTEALGVMDIEGEMDLVAVAVYPVGILHTKFELYPCNRWAWRGGQHHE